MTHVAGVGKDAGKFKPQTSRERAFAHNQPCSSLFLQEALEWMGDTSKQTGKLYCPKCQCRLGSYQWSGSQCSCGHWQVPSFQISISRIDTKSDDALPTISQPH